MRRSRFILLVASAGLLTGGALAACSSSSGDNTFDQTDSGTDATVADTGTDSAPPRDSSTADVFVPPGSCPATTLPGSCDLVLQNCGAGKECDPIQNSDGTVTAQCEPAGTGSVPLGHECCQNAANNGDCVSGTFCNADCANPDAGPGTKSGRCAPFCCSGDNTVCGSSDPEGIKGLCNVTSIGTLPDGGPITFGDQCTYDISCEPFGVQPCSDSTATCTLAGDKVSFKCSSILSPPGVGLGGACNAGNACQAGLECLGAADGGSASVCTEMCFIAEAGAPPFTPNKVDGGVGTGGCPSGQTCAGTILGGPVWYGFCAP